MTTERTGRRVGVTAAGTPTLSGANVNDNPQTDQAALRDRIAEVLWPLTDWDGDQLNAERAADAVMAVLPAVPVPPTTHATPSGAADYVSVGELAHAIDNSTPYPVELDAALCRFMAERLLEMVTIAKRAEHVVWQPEEEPPPGPQPEPEDPAELRRMADEAQQQPDVALAEQAARDQAILARVRRLYDSGPLGTCCRHLVGAALSGPGRVADEGRQS